MKKIFLVSFVIVSIASFCVAGELTKTGIKTKSRMSELKTLRGAIASLTFPTSQMDGNRAELVLQTWEGKETFTVRTGIGISAPPADKLMKLRDLKPGDIIAIEYIFDKKKIINKIISIELQRY
ncbi:MAG: hypothetical protein WC569_03375 [Candidatus Omnitrophota bacterium]